MKALILCGGTGTRLRPLTYTNAKQLIPVANRPTLFHIIDKVVNAGIQDIGIVVGDTGNEIKQVLEEEGRWDASFTYIYQSVPKGLAHAAKTASDFISDSNFLMILGDNLFQMELEGFIDHYNTSRTNASILLHKVADPSQYGVAAVENGHIKKLVEKPKEYVSNLIITGIYLFDKSIFAAIDRIKPSARGELEITDAIQNLLDSGGNVSYMLTQGWWKDTGKLEDILEANRLVLDQLSYPDTVSPHTENVTLAGKISAGTNVTLKNTTIIGPAIIGDGCTIENSYIGPYSSIDNHVSIKGCELENSIIMENAVLQNVRKRIGGSLIGRSAVITGSCMPPDQACFLIGDNSRVSL